MVSAAKTAPAWWASIGNLCRDPCDLDNPCRLIAVALRARPRAELAFPPSPRTTDQKRRLQHGCFGFSKSNKSWTLGTQPHSNPYPCTHIISSFRGPTTTVYGPGHHGGNREGLYGMDLFTLTGSRETSISLGYFLRRRLLNNVTEHTTTWRIAAEGTRTDGAPDAVVLS